MPKKISLTEPQIKEIKILYNMGHGTRFIGLKMNLNRKTIKKFIKELNLIYIKPIKAEIIGEKFFCTTCCQEKSIIERKSNKRCINCYLVGKEYQNKYKNEISNYQKQYKIDNKDRIKTRDHIRWENNKDEIKLFNKNYRVIHKEEIKAQRLKYKINNKEQIRLSNIKYRKKNKEKIAKKKLEMRKNNINIRIRHNISRTISKKLKQIGKSKNGKSCLQYLGYTINELKIHLESLFEPWMNWQNHGPYIAKEWNEQDITTWRWNIDHIVPHSNLSYNSMEDDNFKKCWALSNLRPYSAKQNILDGVNKTRHK